MMDAAIHESPLLQVNETLRRVADVFGPDVVWDNRPATWLNTWEREPLWFRDLIAARLFPVIQDRPVLLPASSLVSEIVELFSAAGLPTATNVLAYRTEEERSHRIAQLSEDGYRVSLQTPAPYDSLPHCAYAIDRDLISYLNNKRTLSFIAPRNAILRRQLSSVPKLKKSGGVLTWPQALKACMSQPSMGGDEVFLCRNEQELLDSLDKLHPSADVALEPWTPHSRNLCVQFLVEDEGSFYLGATEQIIEESTKIVGNYVDSRQSPPASIVVKARECADLAGRLGYRGVVGFDVLVSLDLDQGWIIDANFRLNGSTTALLLYQSVFRKKHDRWRVGSCVIDHDKKDELRAFERAVTAGLKVPLTMTSDAQQRVYHVGYMLAVV